MASWSNFKSPLDPRRSVARKNLSSDKKPRLGQGQSLLSLSICHAFPSFMFWIAFIYWCRPSHSQDFTSILFSYIFVTLNLHNISHGKITIVEFPHQCTTSETALENFRIYSDAENSPEESNHLYSHSVYTNPSPCSA
jgi:hypothetical protein